MEVTPVASTGARNLPMGPTVNGADPIVISAPATGAATYRPALSCVYQLINAGGGSTVIVEVTMEDLTAQGVNNNWVTLATLVAGTTASFADPYPIAWRWIRARTTVATTATSVLMGG